ncbi:trypsin-like peptidase domain-containing protein [Pleionea sediminis]|uniref:trypsin-like peptidase domain-containing protein n=1 Tax=Pleionea sediminis TaxID=2569479 RepID=UPI00118661AE|nr:trypsin-like peptidase domain-containing protein [Pleionea sediminis]
MTKYVSILFFLVGFIVLNPSSSYAEVISSVEKMSYQDRPFSLKYKSSIANEYRFELPRVDVERNMAKALDTKRGQGPYLFAEPYYPAKSRLDDIRWTEVSGTSVWRIRFSSPNAKSLNIGLTDLFLPQDAKVYFYTPDGSQITRFDERSNKSHGQLWTPAFHSNELIMELNVPSHLQKYVTFNIKSVNQGFRSIKPSAMEKSGDCNINVICPVADDWRNEIRAVARILINGSGLCTGTLVNNVAGDNTPYFLSANHCGITNSTASTIVFYWNFETSQCNMNTDVADGSLTQFQSGSTFRARSEPSDFSLVELDSNPEAAFNVHFAGWDATDTTPNSVVAIHHPSGDEKRISFENDTLTITSYGENATNPNGTHFRVGAWDLGTTEGGSSGSAIWNSDKRVVGTLHGGLAACSAPNDPDWYGRVSVQWLGGGTASTQLKAWLDPDDTGVLSLDGFDGCDAPTGTVTLSSSAINVGDEVTGTVDATGGSGAGYTYSWDFNNDGTEDGTGTSAAFTYSSAYSGNVIVRVTDGAGCKSVAVASIVVTGNSTGGGSSGGGGSLTGLVLLLLARAFFIRRYNK